MKTYFGIILVLLMIIALVFLIDTTRKTIAIVKQIEILDSDLIECIERARLLEDGLEKIDISLDSLFIELEKRYR